MVTSFFFIDLFNFGSIEFQQRVGLIFVSSVEAIFALIYIVSYMRFKQRKERLDEVVV